MSLRHLVSCAWLKQTTWGLLVARFGRELVSTKTGGSLCSGKKMN